MALLTPQTISRSGLNPTMSSAAGGGDTFVNTEAELVLIRNATGSAITLSVAIPKTYASEPGLSFPARTVNVPAAISGVPGEVWVGPFKRKDYNNESSHVSLTYSSTSSISVAVVKLGT